MNLATYLIGSQLAIAVLYIMYKAWWGRDTFLSLHRGVIVTGLIFALTYPLLPYLPGLPTGNLLPTGSKLPAMLATITVTPHSGAATLADVLTGVYWAGAATGMVWLTARLFSLLYLRRRCRTAVIEGTQLLILPSGKSPFSFFKTIFIPPVDYSPEMLHHIICHEKAHVAQGHTCDILLGEIALVIGWFNPFVWLLRNEIRLYTEQLADAAAIKAATSAREYQLHLLQATTGSKHPLGPAFGKQSLPARIKMLNRNTSPCYRKLYYIIALPLAALLIMGAQACKKQPSDRPQSAGEIPPPAVETVYDTCETMPRFPGGEKAMMEFIATNLKYPQQAVKENIQGAVLAEFVIDAEGKATAPQIIRSLSPECDREVIRVINLMPAWTPGQQEGKAVNVKFTIPIMYRLQ